MSKQQVVLPGLIAAGFVVAGCAASHTTLVREPATPQNPGGELVLREQRNEPTRRVVDDFPVRPGVVTAPYVWAGGYWLGTDEKWVWIPAHEEALPRD